MVEMVSVMRVRRWNLSDLNNIPRYCNDTTFNEGVSVSYWKYHHFGGLGLFYSRMLRFYRSISRLRVPYDSTIIIFWCSY